MDDDVQMRCNPMLKLYHLCYNSASVMRKIEIKSKIENEFCRMAVRRYTMMYDNITDNMIADEIWRVVSNGKCDPDSKKFVYDCLPGKAKLIST